MSEQRLHSLPVAHLERLFSGGGLPLVSRSPGGRPVTSATVRGEPGTGKTTLALALALAVAGEHAQVCYLTTEAFAVELVFKARMLGLPEGAVADIGGSVADGRPRVSVQHLLLTEVGQASEAGASRPMLAIEAAWELFGEAAPAGGQERFGAVVLDAFGLIDRSTPPPDLRERLVELVQHLEHRGIGVMLVAESGSPEASWLGYVTDLTFDLSLMPDERGQLRRKLSLPKSRFVQALAGPHDYGLDPQGRPAVWPELESVQSIVAPSAPQGLALPVVLPGDEAGQFYLVDEGIVAVSEGERTELPPLERLIPAMRGTSPVVLRLGLHPSLGLPVPGEQSPRVEPISPVVHYPALSLRLERALQEAPGAHLVITGASALAASPAGRHFAGSSLAALCRQGAPIWVQGLEGALLDLGLRARVRVTQSETTGSAEAMLRLPRRAFLLPFAPRLLAETPPFAEEQLALREGSLTQGDNPISLLQQLDSDRHKFAQRYPWHTTGARQWREAETLSLCLICLCLGDWWGAMRWALRSMHTASEGGQAAELVRAIAYRLRPHPTCEESVVRMVDGPLKWVAVAALLPTYWESGRDAEAKELIKSCDLGLVDKEARLYQQAFDVNLVGPALWNPGAFLDNRYQELLRNVPPQRFVECLLHVVVAERAKDWRSAERLRRSLMQNSHIPKSFWS